MMLYWELFTVFFKIGLFSFGGGLAMISIIQQEVVGRGWIPAAEYARIITISQITPRPYRCQYGYICRGQGLRS